jgi:penicillin-binding protein 2
VNEFANRKNTILGFIVVLFVIILGRIFYIQVLTDYYKQVSDQNILQYDYQYPARGLIFDRNNSLLVDNQLVYDVMMIPREVQNFDTVMLATLLNMPVDQLLSNISTLKNKAKGIAVYQPVLFKKQIPVQTYAMLQEHWYKFAGFYVQVHSVRAYPRKLAGNLIGYISEADNSDIAVDNFYSLGCYIGKIGIEHSYEKVLRGKRGTIISMRDVHNRTQSAYNNGKNDVAALAGSDFYCTIDATLQEYGERLMQNKLGSIVAVEPATGEILALVSSPNFDPSVFSDAYRIADRSLVTTDPLKPMFNRAVMARYPPGSIFKLVNALVGLQEEVAMPNTSYSCHQGYVVGKKRVGCHVHSSPLNLPQSIQMSCNAYYCQLFRNLIDNPKYEDIREGFSTWYQHVMSFGIGKKLESDIPNELSSTMPTVATYDRMHGAGRWKSLSIVSLAIGQGELGVTPLHMANLAATIANKGFYYIPHLVKRIDGQQIDTRFLTPHQTTINAAHFEPVIEGMSLAVNGAGGSTARVAYLPDVEVCGKTGTAQNPHGEDHSVFVGFAPRHQSKIAIAVYVENAGFGATYAAPIASLMMEKYLKKEVSRTWLEEKMLETNLLPKAVQVQK